MKALSVNELAAVQGGGSTREDIFAKAKVIPPGFCRVFYGGVIVCNPVKHLRRQS